MRSGVGMVTKLYQTGARTACAGEKFINLDAKYPFCSRLGPFYSQITVFWGHCRKLAAAAAAAAAAADRFKKIDPKFHLLFNKFLAKPRGAPGPIPTPP